MNSLAFVYYECSSCRKQVKFPLVGTHSPVTQCHCTLKESVNGQAPTGFISLMNLIKEEDYNETC